MRPSNKKLRGSPMLNINIAAISDFIKYFGSRQIEERAKNVGFIRRNDGKLNAGTFIKAFTVGLWGCHQASLPKVVQVCESIQEGLCITKQALHQKLKSGAELLKEMLSEAMGYALRHSGRVQYGSLLDKFKNIYVCDATHLALPDKLDQYYKGCGGTSKSKAVLKIQTMFNLVTRSFKDIQVREGVEADKLYTEDILRILNKDDLVIQDLGYFKRDFFNDVSKKKAYYLSKIGAKTVFYEELKTPENRPVPLENIFNETAQLLDIPVCMGQDKKTRLPVRLVAVKLSADAVNERLRKAYRKNKNRNISKAQKTLLSWNIVITNAPENKLPAQLVLELYKMRWQIELVFKAWKSHLGLRDVAYGGKDQVDCMLYGRLIVITLMTTIFSRFYALMLNENNRELSILKYFSHLRYMAETILKLINQGRDSSFVMSMVFSKTASKSLCEKRKRKTTLETVLEFTIPKLAVSG